MLKRTLITFLFVLLPATMLCFYVDSQKGQNLSEYSSEQKKWLTQLQKEKVTFTERNYQRKIPKRKIDKEIIKEIAQLDDLTKLDSIIDKIKKSPKSYEKDFEFNNQTEWDLNQEPENNDEFHMAIKEARINQLNAISVNAIKKDKRRVYLAALSYYYLEIMDLFDFIGKDEQGNPKLVLNRKKKNVAVQDFKSNRDLANELKKQSLYYSKNISPEDTNVIQDIESGQMHYNEELPGYDQRADYYATGDPLSDLALDPISYIMNKLIDKDLTASGARDYHRKNLKIIADVLNEANNNPQKYDKDRTQPNSFYSTDIELEVYFKRLMRDISFNYSLLGGAGALLGGFLATWTKNTVISFSVSSFIYFGFEPLLTALGCYQGMRQMYVMHRYYSYRISHDTARTYAKSNGIDQIAQAQNFEPESIIFGQEFNRDVRNSWLAGMIIGRFIKYTTSAQTLYRVGSVFWKTSVYSIQKLVIKMVQTYGIRKLSHSMESTKLLARSLSRLVAKIYVMPTAESLIRYLFPKKNVTRGALRILNSLDMATSGLILTGVGTSAGVVAKFIVNVGIAALIGLDAALSTAAMYTVIYSRLHVFGKIMDRTYYSPGQGVQLAILQHGSEQYHKASIAMFYPICAGMADLSTPPEYDNLKLWRSKRKEMCLSIIKGMEGLSTNDEIKKYFPDIYDYLINDKEFDKDKYFELLQDAYNFPAPYKIVWLSALKSLFPMNYIAPLYWKTQNAIILGPNAYLAKRSAIDFANFLILNPDSTSILYNLNRFQYTVDKLAIELYKKEHLGISDKDIPKNLPINNAFLAYVSYHRGISNKNNDMLLKFSEHLGSWEEKTGWELAKEGIKEGLKGLIEDIKWVYQDVKSYPYMNSFNYITQSETDHIVRNQNAQNIIQGVSLDPAISR